ncbi:MAG: Transcriptional regulator, XRE family [Parcubacteria group bacterium GW2011_GWA1_40_21]|nr:MAG: Transcriptional regulator, XRE family [Parcubacteria group bacterium GW2011_GWA1_40_21]
MKNFNELKKKLLQDKTVKKAYGDLAPQYALIEMITRKRLKAGLSQETLAQKLGTKQSAIARFESGKTNPTYFGKVKSFYFLDFNQFLDFIFKIEIYA